MFGNGDDRQSGTGGATGAAAAAQQTYQAAEATATPTVPPDAGGLPQGLPPVTAAMGAVDPAAPLDALPRRSLARDLREDLRDASPLGDANVDEAAPPSQPMVTGMLFGQSGDTGPGLKRTGSPIRGREAAASRGPRLDPPQQVHQPTDLPGHQPDLSAFKGSPVRHSIATAESSPEQPVDCGDQVDVPANGEQVNDAGKQRDGNGESDVMQNLVATMLAMQQSLVQLTQRIEKSENKKEDAPKIDHKDIQKPDKYSGHKWGLWSEEFKGFLRRRDKRWAVLLDKIQEKSQKPLTDDDYSDIQAAMEIKDEEVYFAFQQQLYEYLKSYTTGEPLSMVLANGVTKALESWRRMADQGRSARERPMRDERRALYHPKQVGLSDVIEAISSWEKKLAEYQRVKTKDIMSDEDKIMCLEDICPEVLQRHLSEQQALEYLQTTTNRLSGA